MKENGDVSSPDHLVGHAPQNEARHTAPAVGRHGHQVDLVCQGELQDSIRGGYPGDDSRPNGEPFSTKRSRIPFQGIPRRILLPLQPLELV